MNFSYSLIEMYKEKLGITSDNKAAKELQGMSSGRLSEIKSGERFLTEEQALKIANTCNLNPEWVLVNLAAETTKSEACKPIWSNLAKKLSKAVCVVMMSGIYFMGAGPDLGKHVFLRRSRLFA
jgi:plasmid maintenance system antidote protein VapI